MCGICGFAYKDSRKPSNRDMLQRMTDMLLHRGPDSEGLFVGAGVGLGVRRLSIIDCKTGDQPMTNEWGSLSLVCNGEIYNYIELRELLIKKNHHFSTQSDTEVIVHLYEEYGPDCVSYLRGMFAFAIWDKDKEELFLARDRIGIKPLYYAFGKDQTLYFGSEQKAVLATNAIERSINSDAFHDLFTFGFILKSETLVSTVKAIPPGHYALYVRGAFRVHQYWDLEFAGQHSTIKSEAAWGDALQAQLHEVLRLHMRSDVPIGAWLSGGIDSSALVALMQRFSSDPVNAFSLRFAGHPSCDEFSSQKTMADFCGDTIVHEHVAVEEKHFDLISHAVWHQESPIYSANHILQLLLSKQTALKNKVVLTGEGADEVFGGYPWHQVHKLYQPFALLPISIRRLLLHVSGVGHRQTRTTNVLLAPRAMGLDRYAALLSIYGTEGNVDRLFTDHWRERLSQTQNRYVSLSAPASFDQWNSFEQMQYIETKTRLVEYSLQITDRASMASSVEARVPFLDHTFVEFCAHIPARLKMKFLREKYIFRKAMKGYMPLEIAKRKKKGLFAPVEQWLAGRLSERVSHFLSEEQVRKKGYFDPVVVDSIYKKHVTKKENYSLVLMMILNVQIWDELFIQNGAF